MRLDLENWMKENINANGIELPIRIVSLKLQYIVN
jgi:hypothetical protein